MEVRRDLTLDYAKGVAMVSIVIGHLYFYSGRFAGSWVFDICDTIQIPVFMYISGLLAHRSIDRYGFRKLVSNRAVRLMLPLLSFYIIRGLIDYHEFERIPHRLYKRGYWFMLVLFELMVTLSFIKRFSTKFNIPTYVVNFAIFALVAAYLMIFPYDSFFNYLFSINLYCYQYPFFMLGYYHYRLNGVLKLKFAPVYFAVYAVSLYVFHTKGLSLASPLCKLSSLLFLMTVIREWRRPFESQLAVLGKNSLQIYLLHFFILLPLCEHLPLPQNPVLLFVCFFAIALAIIMLTLLVAKLLMKSDLLNLLLFGTKKKKQEPEQLQPVASKEGKENCA